MPFSYLSLLAPDWAGFWTGPFIQPRTLRTVRKENPEASVAGD